MSDIKYNFKKIGERIRSERKATGMNQTILALHLQEEYGMFDRRKISEWENGKHLPDMNVLLSLCNIFHCDIGYLLCEYDYKTRPDTDIGEATGLSQEAINALKGLSPDLMAPLNFMLADKEEKFKWALQHLGDYKLACIRTSYEANKDLLKPLSHDERREKYVNNETNLDSLYAREYFINQFFGEAAARWIRQKQKEVNDLSLDEMQRIIDDHIQ